MWLFQGIGSRALRRYQNIQVPKFFIIEGDRLLVILFGQIDTSYSHLGRKKP